MSFLKGVGNFLSKAYGFGKKAIHGASKFGGKISTFLKSDTARNLMGGIDAIAKISGSNFRIGDYHRKATNFMDKGNRFLAGGDNILDNVKNQFKNKKEDNTMERRHKKLQPRQDEDYMEDMPKIKNERYKDRSNNSYDNIGRGNMFRLFQE